MLIYDSSLIYLYIYLISYNIGLFILFCIFINIFYELNFLNLLTKLTNNFNFKILIIIALFSIAGIPPFFGFFIKITLLYNITIKSYLFIINFSILLLISLYFYLQNIKYLMILNNDSVKLDCWNLKLLNINLFYYTLVVTSFLIFGVFLFDDFFILINWFFNLN